MVKALNMPYTRMAFPLRYIGTGEGHVSIYTEHIPKMAEFGTSAILDQPDQSGK